MDFLNKINQMIKQVLSKSVNSDVSEYPNIKVSYSDKVSECTRLSVYGISYFPPENTWGLSFSSNAQESVKFIMFNEMKKRFKSLKPGEVVLHNPETETYLKMAENGDIEVNSKNDINISVAGSVNLDIAGDCDIESVGNATIKAPVVIVDGDLSVTGKADIVDVVTAKDLKTPTSVGYKNHIHNQPNDSGGDSELPTGGPQ